MSSSVPAPQKQARIVLPAIPALAVNARGAALLSPDGEITLLSHERAQMAVHGQPVMVCHAPYTRHRLGANDLLAFDVLELFAFVQPARFAVPTPAGLARTLGLGAPKTFEDTPFTLLEIAQALLGDAMAEPRAGKKLDLLEIAQVMGLQGRGWNWTPFIFAARSPAE